MIDIGKHRDLRKVEQFWLSALKPYLFDKMERRPYSRFDKIYKAINSNEKICDLEKGIAKNYLDEYKLNFEEICLGNYEILLRYKSKYGSLCKETKATLYEPFKGLYNEFIHINGYKLLEYLNIRTCPYCNRTYTFVVSKKRTKKPFATRPEFDHFFDKATYPLLSLSLYNLVPSCPICNHGKGNNPIGINPYFEGFRSKFCIWNKDTNKPMTPTEISKIQHIEEIKLKLYPTTILEDMNIKGLGLEGLYNMHRDYVMELIHKANLYNQIEREDIMSAFQGIYQHPQYVYELVWGRYITNNNLESRVLSKLTNDILEQLGVKNKEEW